MQIVNFSPFRITACRTEREGGRNRWMETNREKKMKEKYSMNKSEYSIWLNNVDSLYIMGTFHDAECLSCEWFILLQCCQCSLFLSSSTAIIRLRDLLYNRKHGLPTLSVFLSLSLFAVQDSIRYLWAHYFIVVRFVGVTVCPLRGCPSDERNA